MSSKTMRLPFGGSGPTGECVNSRTKVPCNRRLARDVGAVDDDDPAVDGQIVERCAQRAEVALEAFVIQFGAVRAVEYEPGCEIGVHLCFLLASQLKLTHPNQS